MQNSLEAINVYQLQSYNMYSNPRSILILTRNLRNLNMYLIFYEVALTPSFSCFCTDLRVDLLRQDSHRT